jgi:hypothetical protein
MSQNLQKRNKDSKEVAERSIEQSTVNEGTKKTTESVEVTGTRSNGM